MKKYQVGIEFLPSGEMKSTKGLISGRKIAEVKSKIKLNKKTNSYFHVYFDKDENIIEIWKLTKKEYQNLNCGFGLTDFGDFLQSQGLL